MNVSPSVRTIEFFSLEPDPPEDANTSDFTVWQLRSAERKANNVNIMVFNCCRKRLRSFILYGILEMGRKIAIIIGKPENNVKLPI